MSHEESTNQENGVQNVFHRHLTSFESGDLEAVLCDFCEDSVIVTPDGAFVGLNRIRLVYGALLAEFGTIRRGDSPGFTIDSQHAHGDTLVVNWHAESQHNIFPFGSDTFICAEGKIVRQTISYSAPLAARGVGSVCVRRDSGDAFRHSPSEGKRES